MDGKIRINGTPLGSDSKVNSNEISTSHKIQISPLVLRIACFDFAIIEALLEGLPSGPALY